MKTLFTSIAMLAALVGSTQAQAQAAAPAASTSSASSQTASAIFAGGCFWCIESDFEKLPGVLEVESGYTDGKTANPTYREVSAGGTGHVEAVRVMYDPGKVSYATLLEYFWRHIDPTVKDRQFCDAGTQYRSAIFYDSEAQHKLIEASKAAILKAGQIKVIHTQIAPVSRFYVAEEYHQDYYKKNPLRYRYYRASCGRDSRVAEVWGTKN